MSYRDREDLIAALAAFEAYRSPGPDVPFPDVGQMLDIVTAAKERLAQFNTGLSAMVSQVVSEEIEYQPGYWVWQMEAEIRDAFVDALTGGGTT